jgi:hypothetical protein
VGTLRVKLKARTVIAHRKVNRNRSEERKPIAFTSPY